MIHVLATIQIDPQRREEFLAGFRELTPQVHAESGCLEYGVAVDEPTGLDAQRLIGDAAVVVVEKWESVAALQAHLAAPHMDAWREKSASMVRGVEIQVLKPA